jgi:5-formyltetrahydrofolate cyclo-ligase
VTAQPAERKPDKAGLRRQWRRVRRDSLPAAAAGLEAAALREIPPRLAAGRLLGLYWPLPGEPDLRALAERLPERVALPAIVPWAGEAAGADAGHRLVYRAWRWGEPLQEDACGIPAPTPRKGRPREGGGAAALQPGELGLLLVPALAIDATGLRLGSGGGWYDRLRADPSWRSVPALAVLPAACVTEDLPRDPWDIPFDGWLDETGLWAASTAAGKMASW